MMNEGAIVTVGINETEFFEKIESIVDSRVRVMAVDIAANTKTNTYPNFLITQSQACEILGVCYETFVKKHRKKLTKVEKESSIRYYSNDVFKHREAIEKSK